MKRFSLIILFISLTSCVSNSEKENTSSYNKFTELSNAIPISTQTNTQLLPNDRKVHNTIIYGIKSIQNGSTLYSYDLELHQNNIIFSDSNLPVYILHHQGSIDTDITEIVYPSNNSDKLYALMSGKKNNTGVDLPGSMYVISSDGKNSYKWLFDFNIFVNYYLSPDEKMIAYYDYKIYSIMIINSQTGSTINKVDLSEYKYLAMYPLSWSPDSKYLLLNLFGGPNSSETDRIKEGCYIINISNNKIQKLDNPIFYTESKLDNEYNIFPFDYKYFPRTNKLLGEALLYKNNTDYTKLFSTDLNGSSIIEIPITYNEDVTSYYISPDENYVAYNCKAYICIENILSHQVEIIGQNISEETEMNKKQTLIGWMNKYY